MHLVERATGTSTSTSEASARGRKVRASALTTDYWRSEPGERLTAGIDEQAGTRASVTSCLHGGQLRGTGRQVEQGECENAAETGDVVEQHGISDHETSQIQERLQDSLQQGARACSGPGCRFERFERFVSSAKRWWEGRSAPAPAPAGMPPRVPTACRSWPRRSEGRACSASSALRRAKPALASSLTRPTQSSHHDH